MGDALSEREQEIIQLGSSFYIKANSSLADDRTRVLKQGETFAVLNRYGDAEPIGTGEQGIFHEGTRYLSRMSILINGKRPLLLHSTVLEDNDVLAVDLSNPELEEADGSGRRIPQSTLHIFREILLWRRACYQRVRLRNFGLVPVSVELEMGFAGDFADIFEVRGMHRQKKGTLDPPTLSDSGMSIRYHGLDNQLRTCRVEGTPAPDRVEEEALTYRADVKPGENFSCEIRMAFQRDSEQSRLFSFSHAIEQANEMVRGAKLRCARVETSNEQFNNWINRSYADLFMMVTDTEQGLYPYAGVPWFSTVFGRDGIITAWQCLLIDPSLAKGTLRYLAANQADKYDDQADAEPGKILHEVRNGEMAILGEVPFRRYYGSIDSTPLFVALAAATYERTGDLGLVRELWSNIERAIAWIEDYGDGDGDGFVEFRRRRDDGLIFQGWKDSSDSIFHRDGRLATGAIALCEVQAYVFMAYEGGAKLAEALGKAEQAVLWHQKAAEMRDRFHAAFWDPTMGTYIHALDGEKKPCRVKVSNAGHALFAGISPPEVAAQVAKQLMSSTFFTGWGIRTLAEDEPRYNPMSYHNGSIWPHDNSLIAAGFARYGLVNEVHDVLHAIFDTASFLDLHRLPELLCGFRRRKGQGPTLYPVACLPQAWATASIFLLLQASLSMRIDGANNRIEFTKPQMPAFLKEVRIHDLAIGNGTVDLKLYRHADDVGITVLRKHADVEVVVRR